MAGRRNELVQTGGIVDRGKQECTITRRKVRTWGLPSPEEPESTPTVLALAPDAQPERSTEAPKSAKAPEDIASVSGGNLPADGNSQPPLPGRPHARSQPRQVPHFRCTRWPSAGARHFPVLVITRGACHPATACEAQAPRGPMGTTRGTRCRTTETETRSRNSTPGCTQPAS